jgi:metal-responsive CopG/Arc/MetJ family transcriptional regulator
MTVVILALVKTAVSLPDWIFKEADRTAKRLGISRSELYARALDAFLAKQRGAEVTAALDNVYVEQASKTDVLLSELQYRALAEEGEDW